MTPPGITHSGYTRIPETESQPEPDVIRSPDELRLEDDEQVLAEDFVAQESAVSADSRIRWIHFLLGCAVLLPWNVLINAIPFFVARLEGSPWRHTFGSILTTTFTIANFGFLAHATATSKKASNARRALLSMLCLTILVGMLALSTFVHVAAGLFIVFILLNGTVQAAAGSYLQTAVVAVASLFGPSAMQAVMSGQAAVGVAVSTVQAISAYSSVHSQPSAEELAPQKQPEERSAFMFFTFSTLFLLVSAGAQVWLTRLPAYRTIVGQFNQINRVVHGESLDSVETSNLLSESPALPEYTDNRDQLIRVTKTNAVYNFAVAYVFLITLAVFPSITLSIHPTNPSTHPLIFSAIHLLVFNIGDFLGRQLCLIPRFMIWSAKRLLTLSLARTLFIPIFLACNVQRPSSEATQSSAIISSDFLFMLILLIFGASNGWVSSLCMMGAPSIEHNPRLKGRVEDVDVAATVASFCLIGGLVLGSFASFAVRATICDCNPFRE